MAEIFNQNDTRWGGKQLGEGSLTISQAGCYLSTGAQSLVHGGYDTDPGRLNDQLKDMQRFSGSAMSSDAFLDGIGGAQYVETLWYPGPADLTAPQDTYEDEYYVEIWIDNDQRYTHFMRWVSGHTEEDFTVDDPMYGDQVVLGSRYGGGVASIIQKMVHYRVPNPTSAPIPTPEPAPVQPEPAPVEPVVDAPATPEPTPPSVPQPTPIPVTVLTPPASPVVSQTPVSTQPQPSYPSLSDISSNTSGIKNSLTLQDLEEAVEGLGPETKYVVSFLETTPGRAVLRIALPLIGIVLAHLNIPHLADWFQGMIGYIAAATILDVKNPFIANSRNDV